MRPAGGAVMLPAGAQPGAQVHATHGYAPAPSVQGAPMQLVPMYAAYPQHGPPQHAPLPPSPPQPQPQQRDDVKLASPFVAPAPQHSRASAGPDAFDSLFDMPAPLAAQRGAGAGGRPSYSSNPLLPRSWLSGGLDGLPLSADLQMLSSCALGNQGQPPPPGVLPGTAPAGSGAAAPAAQSEAVAEAQREALLWQPSDAARTGPRCDSALGSLPCGLSLSYTELEGLL